MSAARKTKAISSAQIKKIHTLKSILNLEEEHYRALLLRWSAESSTELSLQDARELIDFLVTMQENCMTLKSHLLGKRGRITKKQYSMMVSLWSEISRAKDYDSLRNMIYKITKTLYLWIEVMDRVDAGHVIAILKEWKEKQ